MRQRFWIIKGRAVIRKILSKCIPCQRLNSIPSKQIMAELPADRLEYDIPPFTNVGVDCFGPIYVTVKRSKVKRYGCLFTCLNMRAVHFEVLFSMDADSFIQALKRFISRRGTPSLVRSDQGTNFTGAMAELKEFTKLQKDNKVLLFSRQANIKWIFNCPAAPHMGGVWERMVKQTKRIMNNLFKNVSLNDETLSTVFAETEQIINSRPITATSDDPRDLEALTPNHLLLQKQNGPFPQMEVDMQKSYRRRWKVAQHLANTFWKRWVKE